jgi:DNA-binding IclR family transcriptional regulator
MAEKSLKRRPKEPDIRKIKAILDVLSQYPEGLWLRQLARAAKLPSSTVKFYLDRILPDFVENIGYKTDEDHYLGFRLVKLRPHLQGKRLDVEAIRKLLDLRKFMGTVK